MIHTALDCSLVGCSFNSWDLFFSIASDAAQLAGVCTPAGTNSTGDFYDSNLYDDPGGLLSGEHDDPAFCYTHYADYPAFHGVGDNDSIPNLQGVWSTTASAASRHSSTGYDGAVWSGINNAKQEDETWATIDPSSVNNANPLPHWAGTEYIVLSGYGFSIPVDATIVSIVAAIKGYNYYDISQSGSPSYGQLTRGGVFNAGLMLNGVLYPFADPSTDATVRSVVHAHPPWPNDPGTNYQSGTPRSSGVWTQGISVNWPRVVDPGWYSVVNGEETTLIHPGVPSQSQSGIKPLIVTANVPGEGPLFLGNRTGCSSIVLTGGAFTVSAHNGPTQKNMNLTPTKPLWTPAEVNDPSFGVGVSAWANLINGGSTVFQMHLFLNCIGIGVYYIAGTGGGGGETGGRDMRPRVWIST